MPLFHLEEEIAIICNRDNGGRMVLLGTEWADLYFAETDEANAKKWMNTALSMDLD
jgi:hypothetical protein